MPDALILLFKWLKISFDVLFGTHVVAFTSAVVALVGGLLFIRYQIRKQRELQQKTLSMEAMRRLWSDRSFEDDIRKVLEISDIFRYAEKRGDVRTDDKQWAENRERIVRVINYYEMLSVGVHEGIYDRDIIKRYNKSEIIKSFNWTLPFIEKIREEYNSQCLAVEFEKFARGRESDD